MKENRTTMRKKLLAVLLTIAMVPALVPSITWADDDVETKVKAQAEDQIETKAENNVESKAENKVENKAEAKAEAKTVAKTETKDSDVKAGASENNSTNDGSGSTNQSGASSESGESGGTGESGDTNVDGAGSEDGSANESEDENTNESEGENANEAKDENANESEDENVNESKDEIAAKIAALKEANKTISVRMHFFVMDASGDYTEAKLLNKTVKPNGNTSSVSQTSADGYVRTKSISIGDKRYTYNNTWTGTGGAVAFPLTLTYDEAAAKADDDAAADVNYYAQYDVQTAATVTVHFTGILQADGTTKAVDQSTKLSPGSGWSFTKKKLESATGIRAGQTFSFGGYKYTYTGLWTDSNGNTIDSSTSITFKNQSGTSSGNTYYVTEDTDFTFTPAYEKTMVQGLDLIYTDRVSTGSGSWSNRSASGPSSFDSQTHTFRDPEAKTPMDHYNFLYWENAETGDHYGDGDTYTYTIDDSLPEGTITTVNFYAVWQPSVTLNYHVDDDLEKSEESFDGSLTVNYIPQRQDDSVVFDGWYDADGNKVDEVTYELPALTGISEDVIQPAVHDVYAKFIVKQNLTIKANDDEKEYDGSALTNDGWTITFGSLLDTDELRAIVEGSATNVGDEGTNKITGYQIMRGDTDVTNLYIITLEDGKLSVTPKEVTVTAEDKSKLEGADDPELTGEVKGLIGDDTITFDLTRAPGESVGTYSITPTGDENQGNYTVTFEDGIFTIASVPGPAPGSDPDPVPGDDPDPTPGDDPDPTPGDDPDPTPGDDPDPTPGDDSDPIEHEYEDDDPHDGGGNQNDDTDDGNGGGNTTAGNTGSNGSGRTGNTITYVNLNDTSNSGAPLTADNAPAASIMDDATPLTTLEDIADDKTPLGTTQGAWALLNLLCVIITAVISILLIGFYFVRKREKEDDEYLNNNSYNNYVGGSTDGAGNSEEKENRKLILRIAGIVPAIVSIIVFLLTEDITLPMQIVDRYTLLMLVILAVECIIAIAAKKTTDEEDEAQEA